MTTKELHKILASATGLPRSQVEAVLNSLRKIIYMNMQVGKKTTVQNLGTFYLGTRSARHGVDPRTGADIQIPKMAAPGLRYSDQFKLGLRK